MLLLSHMKKVYKVHINYYSYISRVFVHFFYSINIVILRLFHFCINLKARLFQKVPTFNVRDRNKIS